MKKSYEPKLQMETINENYDYKLRMKTTNKKYK